MGGYLKCKNHNREAQSSCHNSVPRVPTPPHIEKLQIFSEPRSKTTDLIHFICTKLAALLSRKNLKISKKTFTRTAPILQQLNGCHRVNSVVLCTYIRYAEASRGKPYTPNSPLCLSQRLNFHITDTLL